MTRRCRCWRPIVLPGHGRRTVPARRRPSSGRRRADDEPATGPPERMDRLAALQGVTMDRSAGSLLSVNVGLPRDVSWQGRTVHTAVWKRPVDGPRLARRLNVDGDGQGDLAGHGGEQRAVFVYQIEAYRYWQQQL